jgi:hypothetical protein
MMRTHPTFLMFDSSSPCDVSRRRRSSAAACPFVTSLLPPWQSCLCGTKSLLCTSLEGQTPDSLDTRQLLAL